MATKAIGRKLIEGYSLTQTQCQICEMPIMQLRGKTSCVVCPLVSKKAKKRADLRRKGRVIMDTFDSESPTKRTSDSESQTKQNQKLTIITTAHTEPQSKKDSVTDNDVTKTRVSSLQQQLQDLTDFIVVENRDPKDEFEGREKVISNSNKLKPIEGTILNWTNAENTEKLLNTSTNDTTTFNDTTYNDSYLGTDSSTLDHLVLDSREGTVKTVSDIDQESNMK